MDGLCDDGDVSDNPGDSGQHLDIRQLYVDHGRVVEWDESRFLHAVSCSVVNGERVRQRYHPFVTDSGAQCDVYFSFTEHNLLWPSESREPIRDPDGIFGLGKYQHDDLSDANQHGDIVCVGNLIDRLLDSSNTRG